MSSQAELAKKKTITSFSDNLGKGDETLIEKGARGRKG